MSVAGVAHPVERHLAKVEVASSSLVTRSIKKKDHTKVWSFFFMELDCDRLENLNPTVLWTVGRRAGPRRYLMRGPRDPEVSSLVTRSAAASVPVISYKFGFSILVILPILMRFPICYNVIAGY